MIVAVYMVLICLGYTILSVVDKDIAAGLSIWFVAALLIPGLLGCVRRA